MKIKKKSQKISIRNSIEAPRLNHRASTTGSRVMIFIVSESFRESSVCWWCCWGLNGNRGGKWHDLWYGMSVPSHMPVVLELVLSLQFSLMNFTLSTVEGWPMPDVANLLRKGLHFFCCITYRILQILIRL
ncbi:hypothetical protein TSUD_390560 [Trifolium subterraneum]|uniref:Uncharacterized protein n=1 Tax=Trifolium subterraneum TaxID=3900 RepID=A0A2Z6PAR8_TRISU|nr:hypothetical protein TSUD_390560 [Trifolium subterraneum]